MCKGCLQTKFELDCIPILCICFSPPSSSFFFPPLSHLGHQAELIHLVVILPFYLERYLTSGYQIPRDPNSTPVNRHCEYFFAIFPLNSLPRYRSQSIAHTALHITSNQATAQLSPPSHTQSYHHALRSPWTIIAIMYPPKSNRQYSPRANP